MPSISFYFLSKENLAEILQVLTERYVQGRNLPGTRRYHVFSSEAVGSITFTIIAEDERYAGWYKFFNSQQQNVMINVENYVAVKYDNSCWIGVISEATPEDEQLVKFMHPNRPRKTFYWPKHDDI